MPRITVAFLPARFRRPPGRLAKAAARLAAAACCALFCSCIGAESRVRLNGDGSGVISCEYRVARDLESLGKLDGNERWLPVPVGRADLERSAARIDGLTLVSYSSREAGADTVHRAEFSFADPPALEAFFDSSGRYFKADMAKKKITLSFPGSEARNEEFEKLAREALEGYAFFLALTLPEAPRVSWFDSEGKTAVFPGTSRVTGTGVECGIPMADLVFLKAPLTMEISW
ncbi:MAG: hypothetical protein LBC31_05885 [Treponema sp.]|nr:hypothetical protein [Treponema sp.]